MEVRLIGYGKLQIINSACSLTIEQVIESNCVLAVNKGTHKTMCETDVFMLTWQERVENSIGSRKFQ